TFSSTHYYIENQYSDIELAFFMLYQVSFEQFISSSGCDGIESHKLAAKKALKIVRAASDNLNKCLKDKIEI
ncbi:MAG: hypothetical protein AB8G95_16945, partial [Anaerolineae bacterium]